MIFVSVGTHMANFNRLIKEVDILAEQGILKDVVAQTGYAQYIPEHIKYKNFFDELEMFDLIKRSEFLIVHGGGGIIYKGLKANKKIIVVPRLKRYNEHINDHQLDLTTFLEARGKILAVYDIKSLETAIKKIKEFSPTKNKKTKNKIAGVINEFIRKN